MIVACIRISGTAPSRSARLAETDAEDLHAELHAHHDRDGALNPIARDARQQRIARRLRERTDDTADQRVADQQPVAQETVADQQRQHRAVAVRRTDAGRSACGADRNDRRRRRRTGSGTTPVSAPAICAMPTRCAGSCSITATSHGNSTIWMPPGIRNAAVLDRYQRSGAFNYCGFDSEARNAGRAFKRE